MLWIAYLIGKAPLTMCFTTLRGAYEVDVVVCLPTKLPTNGTGNIS